MRASDLENTLRSILRDLEPYRSDLVLIGGWVPYLYRHYGGFSSWGGAYTLTFELDVLVERPLPAGDRPNLVAVLRDAGFTSVGAASAAAIWVRDVETGEKIEFITEHRGMAHAQGHVVPVTEQPGLGAIPLSELEVVRSHTRTLVLPSTRGFRPLEIRVPTLGAYVVNKALTFIQRGHRTDEAGAPKLVKDLLYLRDLAAAGDEVMAAITGDVEAIARASRLGAERVRTAATNVRFVAAGHLRNRVTDVARMVVQRDAGTGLEMEESSTRGYLLDLHRLLMEAAERHAPFGRVGQEADPDEG